LIYLELNKIAKLQQNSLIGLVATKARIHFAQIHFKKKIKNQQCPVQV
jgi:hypothetical protein